MVLAIRDFHPFYLAKDLRSDAAEKYGGGPVSLEKFLASPLVPEHLKNIIILYREYFTG